MSDASTPAVVITGAGSGIGEACAARMAARGWRVFAGVVDEAQRQAVEAQRVPAITPIVFDVTQADQIATAAQAVAATLGAGGLAGLVNCAGIGISGPLEYLPIALLRKQIEVNLIAPVAVAQAFLPLLRRGTGRIVNISSLAGRFTAPFLGPYCASKHGLEAISDALRQELRPWNLHVVCIQPAVIDTPILTTGRTEAVANYMALPAEARQRYAPFAEQQNRGAEMMRAVAQSPDVVARVVEHALTARRPKTRYVAGGGKWRFLLIARLPDRLRDWVLARM